MSNTDNEDAASTKLGTLVELFAASSTVEKKSCSHKDAKCNPLNLLDSNLLVALVDATPAYFLNDSSHPSGLNVLKCIYNNTLSCVVPENAINKNQRTYDNHQHNVDSISSCSSVDSYPLKNP